jgi:excisionase family DNA binding protein
VSGNLIAPSLPDGITNFTDKQLAALFQTSVQFWRKRAKSGDVKTIRVGRCRRFPREAVLEFLARQQS